MSTLKTHNLQSSDSGSVNIAMTPNSGMVVTGISTFNAGVGIGDSIFHLGDDNTQIRFPSSDTISFESGGSERARINSSGRLGLGTNNPDTTLTVQSGGDAQMSLKNSSGTTKAYVGTAGAFGSAGTDDLRIRSDSSNIVFGFTGAEKLRIDSSGRMLLGTTSANHYPDRMFTINRDAGAGIELRNNSSSTGQISFSDTSGSGIGAYRGYIQYQHNNGSMHFATQSTERVRITPNQVLIGTTTSSGYTNRQLVVGDTSTSSSFIEIRCSSSGTGHLLFADSAAGDANNYTGYIGYTHSNNDMTFHTNGGNERLRIDSSGRVIIGANSTTNASTNADDLVVSGSGNRGITIVSTNSNYSNLFFSDGSSGSAQYAGYVQYNHGNNHLNFGANGGHRVTIYDKDGGTNHSVLQVGGTAGNNHYNAITAASLTFGGGNDINNYFLGVRRENYGGDYTKLDLRWHTGIRMGAQQNYGGIRFFDNEDLNSVKFSIMTGGDFVTCHTTLRPAANNTYNLGNSSYRWGTLYASNPTNTSDRNEKNTITESDLGLDFICKLKPVSYKWNQLVDREGEGLDTKTHYGLISQDVEESVIASGKTLDDFGAIDKPEGDDPMGLSYHEFISPLIKAIQEQQEQIKILQEKIASLEGS